MDPLNQNQNPVANGSQMPPQAPSSEPERSGMGPIAGAVIVIALLVAGALYFYGAKLNQDAMNAAPYIPSDTSSDAMMEDSMMMEAEGDTMVGLPPQSASDEAASIEAEFDAMDMSAIESSNEAELNNL